MSAGRNIDTVIQQLQWNVYSNLQQHWKLFAAEGLFFIILGAAAIIVPETYSRSFAAFLGWLLLAGGAVRIVRAIRIFNMTGFSLWLLSGLLQTVIGYLLLPEPVRGLMTFTLLLTLLFAMEGIIKICLAFMMRPLNRWTAILLSGIASLILAFVVWIGWPDTTTWMLATLLGIDMIFLGGSLLSISWHHKSTA